MCPFHIKDSDHKSGWRLHKINECFKDQQSSLSFLLFLSPVRDLWNQGNMPMDYN